VTADESAKAGRGRLGLLIAAAALVAAWLSALALLAVRTANPVTLNRWQLLDSDAVVVATPQPIDGESRHVSLSIERVLAGGALPDALRLGGVEATRFEKPGRYIVPLHETGHGFAVTPAPPALNGAPLVYPATAEAVRMAEEILATGEARPYD